MHGRGRRERSWAELKTGRRSHAPHRRSVRDGILSSSAFLALRSTQVGNEGRLSGDLLLLLFEHPPLGVLLLEQGHLRFVLLLEQGHLVRMALLELVLLIYQLLLTIVVTGGKELAMRRSCLLGVLLLGRVGVHATCVAVLLIMHLRHREVLRRTRGSTALLVLILAARRTHVRSAARTALLLLVVLLLLLLTVVLPIILLFLLVSEVSSSLRSSAIPLASS